MSILSINVDTLVVSSELPVVASVFITVALLVSVESAFSVAASSTVAFILGIHVDKLVVSSELPVVASVFINVAPLLSVASVCSVVASSTVASILGIHVGKLVVYSELPGALVNTTRTDDKSYRDLSAYSSRT